MQSLAEYLEIEVFKIGFEKGRKEEIKRTEQEREKSRQERIKMVKAMFFKGIDVDTISDITGYSQKEIKMILS